MQLEGQRTCHDESLSDGLHRLQSLREGVSFRSGDGDRFPCAYRSEQVYRMRRMQGEVPEEGDCVAWKRKNCCRSLHDKMIV